MKVLHTFKYLSLLALVGFWGCSSTKQTAQNAGEFDDLYGSSSDAAVISSPQKEKRLASRQPTQRFNNGTLNSDPEYYNEQTAAQYSDDEYYSEVSARKVTRGISADPGWNTDNTYTDGFANGYNTAMMNSSWNRWGWNSPFYGGLSLGIGMGMMSPWGFNRFYSPFYSPFGYSPFGFGGGYAYSPFGYGGGFYDSFYSPFGYGYNSFYSPYSYGYGGYGRNVVVVNNYNNIGASRNATYGARGGSSRDRYNGDFVNTPRSYNNNNGGRRSGELNTANNNTYYSRPNTSGSTNNGTYGAGRTNSRGSDYYYGGSSTSGRASANNAATPSYSAPSNSDYYAAPRSNSRGSYTPSPSSSVNSGSRYSAPQQSRSYQAPTRSYQSAPTRSYEAPTQRSYSPPAQRSYSPPSQPSYSAPSGGSRGGSSGGGGSYSGGGGSRGPR